MTEQPQQDANYNRMKSTWLGEGKPGSIIFGGEQYTVATPDGDEYPVFTRTSMEASYGSLSTTVKSPHKVAISPKKGSDIK